MNTLFQFGNTFNYRVGILNIWIILMKFSEMNSIKLEKKIGAGSQLCGGEKVFKNAVSFSVHACSSFQVISLSFTVAALLSAWQT